MYSDAYEICFYINGKEHTVKPGQAAASTSLNAYLRETAGLKGTKVSCNQGGCGCCAVTVTHLTPGEDTLKTYAVQSCQTPLYSVDGWQITTVEGLGSQKKGFHPIQEKIAKMNGSQCGYCTPGMVMSMYGALHGSGEVTAESMEAALDGNLCRCTGYRPILDTARAFSAGGGCALDIEDLDKGLCPRTGQACSGQHGGRGGSRCLDLPTPGGTRWVRPTSLNALASLLKEEIHRKVKLVVGNTASGIYKDDEKYDIIVDLHQVTEMYSFEVSSDVIKVGAATSLTSLITKLEENKNNAGFSYFEAIINHLKKVGSTLVRNTGSVGGNLVIKQQHPEFPSDVFTLMEAAGAQVNILDSETSDHQSMSLFDFHSKHNKAKTVLISIFLPKFDENVSFKSFKVTPRAQNAHAYVNAAYKIEIENKTVNGKPSIVYGGINSSMVHALKTECFLENKELTEKVMTEAMEILQAELEPSTSESDPTLASPQYRCDLAVCLLYKMLLHLACPASPHLASGASSLTRPVSSGIQSFQEMKTLFPLKEPLPKKTSNLQASGEAVFVDDMPTFQHELSGAFVMAGHAAGTLESVDASAALELPGVVSFISAKDIPEGGANNYIQSVSIFKYHDREIFATKDITYAGQPVGLIVAETQTIANMAVKHVNVIFADKQKPILTIEESMAAGKEYDMANKGLVAGNPEESWKSVDRVIEGQCHMGTQYHFFLENHISLANPVEDGIDVYAATQFANMNQIVAAECLGQPLNYINLMVPRLGGGFGGKAADSCLATCAATVAAHTLDRPVRVSLDLSTVMRMNGKRPPFIAKYKAGCKDNGEMVVIDLEIWMDGGASIDGEAEFFLVAAHIDMGYFVPNWNIKQHLMFTNKQTLSAMRSPGGVPAVFIVESIMEHVAKAMDMDPVAFKEINLYKPHHVDHMGHPMTDCSLRELWQRLKASAALEDRRRQVDQFNKENTWVKRGLSMTTTKHGVNYFVPGHTCSVAIFAQDGSIGVSQSGVEMGQGLYMKVAQAVAYRLGVTLDRVKVRPNHSLIAPNAYLTGGSTSSESAVQAALGACDILIERMRPFKEKFPDMDWKDVVAKCYEGKVDLSAKYSNVQPEGVPFFNYFTYGAAVTEAELDVLTGEIKISRCDLMLDLGQSLNPLIDVGQVEGAFAVGMGGFMTEDIIYHPDTGDVANDSTWEYKPPSAKDVPLDWRVTLLPDRPNPHGVMSSKACGEPPICLSMSCLIAAKHAAAAARQSLHGDNKWFNAVAPYTVEQIQQSVGLTLKDLKFSEQ